jgi:hypothetical protein
VDQFGQGGSSKFSSDMFGPSEWFDHNS